MSKFTGDIDMDFGTEFKPESVFTTWTRASLPKNGYLSPHPCGVYPQDIPVDHVTKLSAIPYSEAEELGFIKIDMLNLHYLDLIKSKDEIRELVKIEPNWDLLLQDSTHPKLFQLSKHGEILKNLAPKSVQDLAEIMALIRPGKFKFLKLYQSNKDAVRKLLWIKDESGFSFKKSHAYAYSLNVVVQLHLIEAGIL